MRQVVRNRVATWLALSAALAASSLHAQGLDANGVREDKKLTAVRATGPIAIDGALDEAAWRDANVASGFTQSEPDEGQPSTEETEVRVLYDETTLYVGFVAHDTNPETIVVNELRKDFDPQGSDAVELVLDTFHDGRNGYLFATNAMGAKWDAQMVNEGREVNPDWDAIWNVRSRITESGWSAEMAIPFASLRFASQDPQTWGINFLRRLRRRREESYWAQVPRNYRLTRVSLAGTLEELRGLRGGRDLRIKPYALASGARNAALETKGDGDIGVDFKYGLTKGLVLDATVNTDFSQVEADEQQINLTRVSVLFPEKREFFLENSGVFQFGPGDERSQSSSIRRTTVSQVATVSNSRLNEIAQPGNDLILFFSRRIGLNDSGEAIPIAAGGRLTGRAGRYSLGALNIQQREVLSSPAVNFTALRLRRQLLANSDIGMMFLNKDQEGSRFNRALGIDTNFRFFNNLNFNGYLAKTFSPSRVASQVGSDVSTRASVNYPSRVWNIRASYTTIGERFHDELGYVPRLGVKKFDGAVGAYFRPQSKWVRELYPHFELHNIQRWNGNFDSRYMDHHFVIRFQDGSSTEPGVNQNVEQLLAPFVLNRRRNIVIKPGRYEFDEAFIWYQPDPSATVALSGRAAVGEFYSGTLRSYRAGAAIRASEHFNVSATITHNRFRLPEGDFNTNLLASRIQYSFSTQMFINALIQYNSDARQWSSNVRFNFIHRPLSDFYLVYNDQRDSVRGDVVNQALIAKLTYLLSF